jgi:ribosomal protein S18 acetylase RimI-like enzyme
VISPASRLSPSIAALDAADRRQAIVALARAFRDNPLNVAVIGAADARRRLRSNIHGMRSLLSVAAEHGYVLVARSDGRVAGVLISSPPGTYPLPAPPLAQQIRCMLGQGWRVAARWGRVFDALHAHHPLEPSWYLGTLGVEPTLQSQGVGSALLDRWLERVDRERNAAYLETDSAANIRFYARAGFDLEGKIEVLGIPIWRMRRAPRAGEMLTESLAQ